MSPPTYTVAIDFNDDGDFTDTGEALTADLLHMSWRLGVAQPYDTLAAPVTARLTLRNPHRAYSPEYSAANLKPGVPLRIQSNDGLTTRTHFTGFIQRVEPQTGTQGERLAVIHAAGPEHWLTQHRIRLPPQVNARADTIIAAVLGSSPLRQTPIGGYWLLDIAGHAELGTNTRLGGSYPAALETGKSTFAYAADTWGSGLTALTAIQQIVESERGRFYVDRFGQLIFYNRHHTVLTTASVATFTDDMDGAFYDYGSHVANHITVPITPRTLGAPASILWQLSAPQKVEPGEAGVRRLTAPYRDSSDRPIGAVQVISPQAGVDFSANTHADGSGADYTSQVVMNVVEAGASAALLEFRNNSVVTIYIQTGAQVRGTPLVLGDPAIVELTDLPSLNLYGPHQLHLETPDLGTLEEAENMARFELVRRKDPRGHIHSLRLSGTLHLAQLLTRTLFDRITVHESQTNHTADYFIIAEEHEVDLAGARHHTRWLLEPASSSAFWILDTSHLDQTTILAY
ncbi:MAG: hypothetical protein R3E39_08295 [Anaerolineae bacterium]